MQKRVVIVGGGFAGVKAALELSKDPAFEITLISNRGVFEYHAALYRSVTGRSVLEVAVPLAAIFEGRPNVEIAEDTIERIEASKQTVISADGCRYFYDKLILAPGNVTAYYGIKGLDKYSYGVKSINQALRLRRHLHDQLGTHDQDSHYVVVGAGPTGVELAAELAAYLKQVYRRHKVGHKQFKIDLVEAAEGVLPGVPELSARVVRRLQDLGVHLDLSTAVEGETADKLQLPHGSIATRTVIWTAGVTGHPLFAAHPDLFKLTRGGKVVVDKNLRAATDIYVLGDSADTKYSGMAQTALYDAKFVAKVLRGKKPTYCAPKPISAIPAGPHWCAVATRFGNIYGYPGWVLRRLADIKLFATILPLSRALRTWAYGNQADEWCNVCAKPR